MKKLFAFIMLAFAVAGAQSTPTPNIGLLLPAYGSQNWDVPLVANFQELDLLLSGNQALPGLNVTGNSLMPLITTWTASSTYSLGALVFYRGVAYTSATNANQGNTPSSGSSFWTTTIGGGVTSVNALSGGVNLVAGSNINLGISGQNITISSNASGNGTVSTGQQYLLPVYTTSPNGTTVGPSNFSTDSTRNNLKVPGNVSVGPPCVATSSANCSSSLLAVYDSFWNSTSSSAQQTGVQIQVVPQTGANPFTFANIGLTNCPTGGCYFNYVNETHFNALAIASDGLTASSLDLGNVHGLAEQCLHADNNGNVTGTGSDCGSGGGGGGAKQVYVLDSYLNTADGHGGTDYGYAALAFCSSVDCNTLQQQVSLITTGAGVCKVFTPIFLPGPVQLDGASCAFIPQSTMANTYVILTGCSTTIGSVTVTCSSTSGLSPGMAIGGDETIGPENYIFSVTNSTTFTLALPATRTFLAIPTLTSAVLNGINNMSDLTAGQTLANGTGVSTGTTISSINYATNQITLSANATIGSISPIDISLLGGTVISGLTLNAIVTTPVISLIPCNAVCQTKSYVTQSTYGASLTNVSIKDPAYGASNPGRSITGVQGIQIYGEDNFSFTNVSVAGIAGSAYVFGGYVPASSAGGLGYQSVREGWIHGLYAYQTGDALTGQACISMMTGYGNGNTNFDENNTIGFDNEHCVYSDAENIVIGTYLHPGGTNGPRILTFSGQNQNEVGASRATAFSSADDFRCLTCGDEIHLNSGTFVSPGFGRASIHLTNAVSVRIMGSDISASGGVTEVYNVGLTPGSTQVTYTSAGSNAATTFLPAYKWNNIGLQINDGGTCAPCYMYFANPSVSGDGMTATLASPYTGSATSGTLTVSAGGYYFHVENSTTNVVESIGGVYSTSLPAIKTLLSQTSDYASFMVGSGAQAGIPQVITDYTGKAVGTNSTGWSVANMTLLPVHLGTSVSNSGQLIYQTTCQNGSNQYAPCGVGEYAQANSGTTGATYHYTQLLAGGGDFYDVVTVPSGVGSGNIYQYLNTTTSTGKSAYQVFNTTSNWQWGILSGAANSPWCLNDNTNSGAHAACFSQGSTPAATFYGALTANGGIAAPLTTPSSSSATCTAGQTAWDASYIYICTGSSTWKRAALSTF